MPVVRTNDPHRRMRPGGSRGVRIVHAERQSLRRQHAVGQPVRRRHHGRGTLRRPARHALGMDRGASLQLARRAVVSGPGAVVHRGAHQAHPAGAGRDRAAATPPDPRRRAADDRISHHGTHYAFDDVRITPKPLQRPIPTYVASFSKLSIELAARLGCGLIVAPFAAAMSFGGLKQVADLYHETCAKHGTKPGRLMCSYFTHFADTPEQEAAQRARQIRYYRECVIPAFPGDPKTAPPSYRYFIGMVERLQNVKPEDLTENSVLLGSPQRIADTLKKVEAAGFSEVILYFNVGLKPHAQVKEEMDRFMGEVAPAFEGAHRRAA